MRDDGSLLSRSHFHFTSQIGNPHDGASCCFGFSATRRALGDSYARMSLARTQSFVTALIGYCGFKIDPSMVLISFTRSLGHVACVLHRPAASISESLKL